MWTILDRKEENFKYLQICRVLEEVIDFADVSWSWDQNINFQNFIDFSNYLQTPARRHADARDADINRHDRTSGDGYVLSGCPKRH